MPNGVRRLGVPSSVELRRTFIWAGSKERARGSAAANIDFYIKSIFRAVTGEG